MPYKNKKRQLESIKKAVLKGHGQIVYFKNVDWRNYLISEERLLREFDRMEVIRLKDGFIIRKPNKQK